MSKARKNAVPTPKLDSKRKRKKITKNNDERCGCFHIKLDHWCKFV